MSQENLIPVSIRLNVKVLEELKKLAREKSFKNNEDISHVDLIRCAIDNFLSNKEK